MVKVVFDTNAYRRLAYDKTIELIKRDFDAITAAEEMIGFQVFMAPVPWIELFSHLVDPSDSAFDNCLKAVVGSFIHCRIAGRIERPKLMPQYMMLVSQTLFQHRDESENLVLYGLNEMAKQIYLHPNSETCRVEHNYLEKIYNYGEEKKLEFMATFENLQKNFHSLNHQKKGEFKDLTEKDVFFEVWASAIVIQAAEVAKYDIKTLTMEQEAIAIKKITDYFAAPCYLARHIVKQMVSNENFNIKKKKRKNWFWDYQMLFYISANEAFILITNDADMCDAARDAGIDAKIVSLEEYLKILRIDVSFK